MKESYLRKLILAEHSRAQCSRIVAWVGNNQQRFDELVKLYLGTDSKTAQRAGWPLSELVLLHPPLVNKHLGAILRHIQQPGLHDAVKRHAVRLLQVLEIPENYQGQVMTLCFNYLLDPAEKPAVKAYALTVLHQLSRIYPEIKQELRTVIEDRWDLETAAFRARANNILKVL